ncbi:MAG: sigma factor [Solirubrobacterales bacterium]
MSAFRRLSQHQLSLLPNEALIEYIVAARAAAERAAERDAVGVLAYGLEPTVRLWVRKDMPAQDVDDVVMDVMASAIRASFDGKMIGEFGSFLKTIAQRRVADYFRREGRRPAADPLGSEHEGEDDLWAEVPATPDETPLVDLRDAIDRVLAQRNPLHQKVIRLYGSDVDGFEDLPADEVKSRIDGDESEDTIGLDNVAQIWSRFKRDVREELGG